MSNRRFPFSGSGERLKFYPNMKAIIAEKPSVGMDIARVVGATDKKDGYCTGNGYMVTWALGHLVSLAMPGAYGYTKTSAENLPMLPDPFRLVSRQVRTDKGMVTDIAAAKQLKIIDSVFDRCDSIIVATDCAREGELIFRWIYSYLGYTKPFKRLWISSLSDEAIREGLANLRDGSDYDSLYAAADCRAKADWLVGMNASRALAVASGSANNSIGRVQTPTLAMVCARFKENRNFVSTPYWQLHLTLKRQDTHRMFIHTEEFKEKDAAEAEYRKITSGSVATVTGSEHKRTFQQAPLLYDLTTLQKDCNVHYDLTAEKTLSIAQSLYEKKLISYPRTGSRHIPEDVMRHIPSLLGKVVSMPEFREYGQSFDLSDLNTRSVDDTKVTDHHALIITGISPEGLSEAESTVYTLIAGRMLEAFSPPCEKELLVMECACEGMAFRSRSSSIVRPGWRGVFARKEDREKDEPERDGGTAEFAEGETVPVMGHGMAQKKTLPKPLYTEATLLAAMETCGKNITDEQAKEAIKELGIGTPATRAAIITTLVKRDYIARSGKSIIPTEKGMYIYEAVKDMRVADVELTGSWEKTLAQVERHTLDTETFMQSILDYTRRATEEILRLDFPAMQERAFTCPKCKTGKIILRSKVARCDHDGCGLLVFRRISPMILKVEKFARLVAPSDMSVMILGANGTGKESVAQTIHDNSERYGKPFVAVNCGALPRELAASLFFGHEKGAFTGADTAKTGYFDLAKGGTLFLDEIGTMPHEIQSMLLRVLQENVYTPIGSGRERISDVRVISATNENMEQAIKEGRFREDLYHRLNEFEIRQPSLEECPEDIIPLAEFFRERFSKELKRTTQGFTEETKQRMLAYRWPGNVRELRNRVKRAVLVSESPMLDVDGLEITVCVCRNEETDTLAILPLKGEAFEKESIIRALKACNGHREQAAGMLNINPATLYRKMKKYGLK